MKRIIAFCIGWGLFCYGASLLPSRAQVNLPLMGVGKTSGGGSWTPASEGANLLAWWETTNGISQTGGDLTSWADQSGNGYTASPTLASGTCSGASVAVAYSATSFNSSYPGLTVNLSTSLATCLGPSTIAVNSANFSYFASIAPWYTSHGSNNGGRLMSIRASGQTNDYDNGNSVAVGIDTSTTHVYVFGGAGGGAYVGPSDGVAISDGTFHTFGVTFNGTVACYYVDGSLQGSCASWTTNIGNSTGILASIFTGTGAQAGNNLAGILAETVLSKSVITPSNYQSYALTKWGL